MAKVMQPEQSAAARFEALKTDREPYLSQARECAKLSLPFICPPDGTKGQRLPQPWQSIGARCVNNLAAKLLLALFPPNTPFFRLSVDRFALKKISKDAKLKTALDSALSEIEQGAVSELEAAFARPTISEALTHLLVTGNGLIEVTDEGPLKFYALERYVIKRDPMGAPQLIILHECVSPSSLPEDFLKKIRGINPLTESPKAKKEKDESHHKNIDLYTVVERESATKWVYWQEAKDTEIEGTRGTCTNEKLPYIPLRFIKVDGEDYGRGLVEQYFGDLNSLEALSQALAEGALAAAKVLFLVSPNGLTDAKELAEASNGDFVAGREEDVKPLQMQKFYDFRTAKEEKDSIEQRLNAAFLVLAGLQRQAERVTAEEIRALVNELETSLGGIYSVQAQEFQLPLAACLMARMAKDNRLPQLPKKVVKPTITTGVEALGRGNDLQKLDLMVKDIAQTFGPEAVARYVNAGEYLRRRAAALGVNIDGLIRSEDDIAASDQQQQQQAVASDITSKVAPVAAKALLERQAQPTQ